MIRRLSALLAGMLLCAFAFGQSVPNGGTITLGQVWTVAQWIAGWQSKADVFNPSFTGVVTINGLVLAPSFPANPTCSIGLTIVNGSASTFPRSDASCALSQSISPNWSSAHIFSPPASVSGITVNGNTNAFGIVVNQQTSAGTSLGVQINAGTNASDSAIDFGNAAKSLKFGKVAGDGGLVWGNYSIGSPAGGSCGIGCINAAALEVSSNPVLTTASTLTPNANNLTGTTLNSGVVNSSLTSVGTLASLAVTGAATVGSVSIGGAQVQPNFSAHLSSTFATTSVTLANTPLSVTLPVGNYAIDMLLNFSGSTTGSQGIAFSFAGTSTVANSALGALSGRVNGASAVAAWNGVNAFPTIALNGTPDSLMVRTSIGITVAGTYIIQVAQNSSSGNATNLLTDSYIVATRLQ